MSTKFHLTALIFSIVIEEGESWREKGGGCGNVLFQIWWEKGGDCGSVISQIQRGKCSPAAYSGLIQQQHNYPCIWMQSKVDSELMVHQFFLVSQVGDLHLISSKAFNRRVHRFWNQWNEFCHVYTICWFCGPEECNRLIWVSVCSYKMMRIIVSRSKMRECLYLETELISARCMF